MYSYCLLWKATADLAIFVSLGSDRIDTAPLLRCEMDWTEGRGSLGLVRQWPYVKRRRLIKVRLRTDKSRTADPVDLAV